VYEYLLREHGLPPSCSSRSAYVRRVGPSVELRSGSPSAGSSSKRVHIRVPGRPSFRSFRSIGSRISENLLRNLPDAVIHGAATGSRVRTAKAVNRRRPEMRLWVDGAGTMTLSTAERLLKALAEFERCVSVYNPGRSQPGHRPGQIGDDRERHEQRISMIPRSQRSRASVSSRCRRDETTDPSGGVHIRRRFTQTTPKCTRSIGTR
jgi:hypothetical protein